jgi:hypothetical protein
MLGQHGEALTKKCVLMAMQGDTAALRLCMERLLPVPKQSPVQFKLPPIDTAADLAKAQAWMLEALSRGQLTPADAETINNLFESRRRILETEELARRLQALEARGREEHGQ